MEQIGAFLQKIRPIKDGDSIDQLSYLYTVIVLAISAFLVFGYSFVGTPLECWFPPQFKGWWNEYARDYCFVQNTYFTQFTEVGSPRTYFDLVNRQVEFPKNLELREEKLLGYYQWVPFVLALVGLSFYAPVLLWRAFAGHSGINVRAICELASSAETVGTDGRDKHIRTISRFMDLSVVNRRALHGGSRVLGRYVVILFIFMKFLFLVNAIAQFFTLQKFIGAQSSSWGVDMLTDMAYGKTWAETGNFPRVTFCDFDVRELGSLQHHTVQCVLLINMFNEKIFIFLWWWFLAVVIFTALGFFYWLITSLTPGTGRKMVSGYLGLSDKALAQSPRAQSLVQRFVDESLRPDGVFLIRLVGVNAGDVVAADLTYALWQSFKLRNSLLDDTNRDTPLPPANAPPVSLASPYAAFPTLPRYEDAIDGAEHRGKVESNL